MIPITVNCIRPARDSARPRGWRGSTDRHGATGYRRHSPERCFALGEPGPVIRDTDLRVALVASSRWSHAFITDKAWHITPDARGSTALQTCSLTVRRQVEETTTAEIGRFDSTKC